MAIGSRFAVTPSSRKYHILWTFWILVFLFSTWIVTSLGQTLLVSSKKAPSAWPSSSVLLDNPVFSPLLPSRFRALQVPSGTHVIYDGDARPDRSIAFDTRGEWWASEPEQAEEGITASGIPHAAGKVEPRSLFPILRSRDFYAAAAAGDLINLEVAELLNLLRERELKRLADKGDASSNPFDEALKATPDDTAAEKTNKTAEVQPAKKPTKDDADASGDTAAKDRNFLLVGSFNDQPLAAVVASSNQSIVNSESVAEAFGFDLAGVKQYFDLNVILRNRDNLESVAFGDLNGDGLLDLVVTNKTINQSIVYLNDGQGGYVPRTGIYGGFGPGMAAIGEFGGDGSPDIAVMLQTDKRIIVDGKGLRKFIFLPTSDIAGDGYSSMIPHDFDGDGLQDLLLSDYRNSTATVYRNLGQALFAAGDTYTLQSFPLLQTKSDLNGDGIEDLVFVQYLLDGYISIVFQNGLDGTISSLANTILDPAFYYVVGDFDQDGIVDIALARRR